MAADWKTTIEDQYNKQMIAQRARMGAARDISAAGYGKQLADAPEQYQSLKNEAYVNNAMAEQTRKENMANMGLSGAGGTSQTLAQRNQMSLLGRLGDVSRQQQDYTDNVNMALSNLNTQYNADLTAAENQNAADMIGAQNAYGQWQDSYGLSAQQYGLSQSESKFSQAMALFQKKLITKKQLEQMIGYALK